VFTWLTRKRKNLSNKKAYLLSVFSGILFGLCWNNIVPAISLFIALVPFLFVFENRNWHYSQVFKFGIPSFFVFHLGTVWWLSLSSLFGAIVIALLNSMVMAAVLAFSYRIRQVLGFVKGLVFFIISWISFEYVHYHWELSWPFMNLGNWLGQLPNWIQWYEYTGVLGGTLWILIINVLVYFVIKSLIEKRKKYTILFAVSSLVIFILPVLISKGISNNLSFKGKEKSFLVIQPNIDPYSEKYNTALFENQIAEHIDMAKTVDSVKVDCIVFPESSFPVYLEEDNLSGSDFVKRVENELVGREQVNVVGGFYSYKLNNGDTLFYNTAFMVDSKASIQLYHKSQLVIGVEKMPFEKYFSFLKDWNLNFGGYNTSLGTDSERKVFVADKNGLRIAPVICYESVYGQFVTEFIENGANFIAVITNDAWWGDTPGYKQHLMHSQLRAIENRRSVVRSANTGVSCFINPKGEIISEIKPWTKGVLVGRVPENTELTFYAKNGDYIGVFAIISVLFLSILAFFKNKQN
jgi:apolipoprotein N-acyltransferase